MGISTEAISLFGGHYTQFLDDNEFRFVESYGSWAPTNASLLVEKTFRFPEKPFDPASTYSTLRVQPLVAETPPTLTEFSITSETKTIPTSLGGDYLVGFVFVYSLVDIQLAVSITNGITTLTSMYVDIPSSTWILVRSDELLIPTGVTPTSGQMSILFRSPTGTSHCHIAHPVLTNSYGFTQNLFLRESFVQLPQYLVETDALQASPSQPLARLMDIGLAYADKGFRQADTFRYLDIAQGFDANDPTTRSTLVDPITAEPRFLPWLAQFVGARIETTTTSTTPWQNLPLTWEGIHEDIDPAADVTYSISSITRDGSGTVTAVVATTPSSLTVGDTVTIEGASTFNGQFELTSVNTGTSTLQWSQSGTSASGSTGTVTLVDSTWIEIETYNYTDSNLVAGRRGLVTTARTGHNAGTYQAMEDSISGLLSGTKTIKFVVDPVASPWTILVKTLTSETIDGVSNTESQILIGQLRAVKPLGFVVNHLCVDSL